MGDMQLNYKRKNKILRLITKIIEIKFLVAQMVKNLPAVQETSV